jgi:hypothetical protein
MPLFDLRKPKGGIRQPSVSSWDTFRGGLNTFLQDTEIGPTELAQSDNIVLTGLGVPTKRWGYKSYFQSGSTGSVRGLQGYYTSAGGNELVSITDAGYLTIKSGASYTTRSGASWASGYNANMVQLDDNIYVVNGQRELVRYSTPTLTGFPTISIPTSTFATQISGSSGADSYSYRVSSVSDVGETIASTAYEVTLQPDSLSKGAIKVSWAGVSAASTALQGYNIYGRVGGDERFLSQSGPSVTEYIDDGTVTPMEFGFPPLTDSTGGVNAKYIERFQDRLVYAGISGDPSKVIISGRVPFQERNDIASGGNYIRIEPDAGDDITGIKTFGSRLIVFKEKSIWEIGFSIIQVGNFFVTQPEATLITSSYGCVAPRSIAAVENDLLFLSIDGVYTLGYEPNILNVLRTNELSVKIRPFFDGITGAQKKEGVAFYAGFKYILSFPGADKSVVFDRERQGWVGPWTFDARTLHTYFDSSDNRVFLLGQDDGPTVQDLSSLHSSDDGTAIKTTLRTRKEDFGDWTLFKTIEDIYLNMRNVSGTVVIEVRVEDIDGSTSTVNSFTLSTAESAGNSGWGADLFSNTEWGNSEEAGSVLGLVDLVEWLHIGKTARRVQLIIRTNDRSSNYELLGVQNFTMPIGRGLKGSSWRLTT